jgi:hypothetical protein
MDNQYQIEQKARHDTEVEYNTKTQQNRQSAPTYILHTDTEPRAKNKSTSLSQDSTTPLKKKKKKKKKKLPNTLLMSL